MSAFEQLAMAWQAIARTLRSAWHGAPWTPFAVLGALQLGVVALLWGFAHPAVSWFMAPLLRSAGGEELLHYPNLFRVLPALYGRVDLVVGATLGAIAVGAAIQIFANDFTGHPAGARAALTAAGRRSLALMLANLPFNVLAFGLSFGLDWLLVTRGSAALTRRLSDLVALAATLVVQSLFFYVACDVMLAGRGAWGALAAVPRAAARGFWAALGVGVLTALPLLPLQFLSAKSGLLVDRGTPELVGWLTVAEWGVGLAVWFVLAGSSTLLYLTLVHADRRRIP